jgi:hypothetical protein
MAGDFKPIALSNEPYANSAPCSELMCVLYCVRNLALANRVLGYSMVLTPIRVSLFILADTSYNERRVAEYNRIHTASRPNLEVFKVRASFAIKHHGLKSVNDYDAEHMYERWLRVISKEKLGGTPAKGHE